MRERGKRHPHIMPQRVGSSSLIDVSVTRHYFLFKFTNDAALMIGRSLENFRSQIREGTDRH